MNSACLTSSWFAAAQGKLRVFGLIVFLGGGAVSAQVNVLVYEGFDYAAGTTLGPDTQGGVGWSGGWYGDITLTSTAGSRGTIGAGSYDVPPGMIATGNHVEHSGFSSGGVRLLADQIDTTVNNTIYFSIAGHFTSGAMSLGLRTTQSLSGPPVVAMSITAGNATMRLYNPLFGSEDGAVTRTIASGISNADFFWVGKLVTTNGNDRLDTWFYSSADLVPLLEPAGLANVAGSNVNVYNVTQPIDRVQYLIGAAGNGYDEFRIGTTWDSVVAGAAVSAVPEPSTYAAIAGAAALGLAAWRRRTRDRASRDGKNSAV